MNSYFTNPLITHFSKPLDENAFLIYDPIHNINCNLDPLSVFSLVMHPIIKVTCAWMFPLIGFTLVGMSYSINIFFSFTKLIPTFPSLSNSPYNLIVPLFIPFLLVDNPLPNIPSHFDPLTSIVPLASSPINISTSSTTSRTPFNCHPMITMAKNGIHKPKILNAIVYI